MITCHPVAVVGANGRIGKQLCQKLLKMNIPVIAYSRYPENVRCSFIKSDNKPYDIRSINFLQPERLSSIFHDAAYIINTAHARHIPALLRTTKIPIIALGSTRKNTQWPDDHARGVIAGEQALREDSRPSIILHPTMIYGAQGENNVQRLHKILDYLPLIPLPKRGQALIQPIEQSDVILCLCSALKRIIMHNSQEPESITIAGPTAITYRDFISRILYYSGRFPRPIINVPTEILMLASQITRILPGFPTITSEEIRRLLEDKSADITAMQTILNIRPISLDEGLKRLFSYS